MDEFIYRPIQNDNQRVRFTFPGEKGVQFIHRPRSNGSCSFTSMTRGVKFSRHIAILDDWWLFGGTRLSRTLYRLKHPIIYSKRGIRGLYRRIKRIFVKPKMIQPVIRNRK